MPLWQWLFGFVLLIGAAGSVAVWAYQEQAVYRFPKTPVTPESQRLTNVRVGTIAASDGTPLTIWFVPPQPGKPVVIGFHGNFTTIGPSFARMQPLIEKGFGLAMLAYRGSASLPGRTTEQNLTLDVLSVYDGLDGLIGTEIPPSRRIIHGFSLGTSPAIMLAANRPAAGLVIEAGFDSLCRFQQRRLHGIPMCALMWKERHDTIKLIGRVKMPMLFAHGALDRAVYPEWGRLLYQAAPDPKQIILYPNGSHADLMKQGFAADFAKFALTFSEE